MAVFVDKLNGYIADNPNIEFERCDGKVFSYDEVNTASMTNNKESITINGGWGNFPLAVIDTTSSLEISFTSSLFSLDMFAMANAVEEIDTPENYSVLESKRFEVNSEGKIVIPYQIVADSVKINGLTATTGAPTSGSFKVDVAAAVSDEDLADAQTALKNAQDAYAEAMAPDGAGDASGALYNALAVAEKKYEDALAGRFGTATVTFASGDVTMGDTIRVAYRRVLEDARVVTVKTTSPTAKGALTATWPVYSAGTDCTEAAVKAYLHMYVPSVRVTQLPGFDSSYKTAGTNGITFTSLDPKRADGKMFDLVYEEL